MKTAGASKILTILALTSALVSVGCGGGAGTSSKKSSASTAGGATAALAPMPEARAEPTAVLLPSGDVFVACGLDVTGNPMASTVIISPAAVTAGPSLSTPRVGASATLLPGGQVLIAGGQSDAAGAQVLSTSELYDPLTSSVSAGPTLVAARSHHVAMDYVVGQSHYVLFAGGMGAPVTAGTPNYLASGEVLDVASGISSPLAASMTQAQANARIARLDSGALLIASGVGPSGPAMAQVFDPNTGTFRPVPNVVARSAAAVASKGAEVLVAGGTSSLGLERSSEVFTSATSTFSQGVALNEARSDASATVTNGEIVLAGGRASTGASATVEVLSGASLGQAQVITRPGLITARYDHAAISRTAGKVMVIGGYDNTGVPLASVEEIDLNASTGSTNTTPTPTGTGTPGSGGTVVTNPGTGTGTGTGNGTAPGTNGNTGSGSGGLSGLLGNLFGGSSNGSSSTGGSILSTVLQSAIQALTASSSSGNGGGGFSGFLQNLVPALFSNLAGNLFGNGNTTGGGSGGLSGALGGLLNGLFGGNNSNTTTSGSTANTTAFTVTSMNPGTGHVGDTITFTAINYGASVTVYFNGVQATVSSAQYNNANVLTVVCTVPAGATTGQVTLSSGGQVASAGNFTVF